jgi:hypothetical protein
MSREEDKTEQQISHAVPDETIQAEGRIWGTREAERSGEKRGCGRSRVSLLLCLHFSIFLAWTWSRVDEDPMWQPQPHPSTLQQQQQN